MGMFHSPAGDFIKQPKAINPKCNNGKEPPFDIAAEQLQSRSIEVQLSAINEGIPAYPALEYDRAPRVGKA